MVGFQSHIDLNVDLFFVHGLLGHLTLSIDIHWDVNPTFVKLNVKIDLKFRPLE